MIPLWRIGAAALLVVVAIVVSRLRRLDLERDLLVGAVRAVVQLLAVGHALRLVFRSDHPAATLVVVAVMLLVAAWTVASRTRRALFPRALLAITLGTAVAVIPVFVLVVPPRPWFEPRIVIAITGMMVASAMNVVAQVFERLLTIARDESALIEAYVALGATPAQAFAGAERTALRAALIPMINGLLTVGLVALPGMMTGQILGGAAPEQAVRYQIVVMFELAAVAAVAGVVATRLLRSIVFTRDGCLGEREPG